MELYATGGHTLSTLRKVLKTESSKTMSRGNIHLILKNRFYVGFFEWRGETYSGTHQLFIDLKIFERVQAVRTAHNRSKHSKREIAFRGLMSCAHDGCKTATSKRRSTSTTGAPATAASATFRASVKKLCRSAQVNR